MKHSHVILALAGLLIVLVPSTFLANETEELLSKIDQLVQSDPKSYDHDLGGMVADQVRSGSSGIETELIARLSDPANTEHQLTIYVWLLGLTRNPAVSDELIELYKKTASETVQATCLRALATIGGEESGEFLLAALATTSDKMMRFNILNMLGQMQYEKALPYTQEILEADPVQYYWQSIFVFGKMGDIAVPFLLERLGASDRNVRANTINVLGQWLIPPEASSYIEKQYWKEEDKVLRGFQLSSLERTIFDLAQMRTTFERIAAKEQDSDLKKFASETIEMIDQAKFTAGAENKRISSESFQEQYTELFNSAGKKGDYEILSNSSSIDDEPKLKALRERILQRDSDEAFYDFQEINTIIRLNRLLKK
jgi:hypothetical protein